jgi:hypothetical protein
MKHRSSHEEEQKIDDVDASSMSIGNEEPNTGETLGSDLRQECHRLDETNRRWMAHDERDVNLGLQRERWFTVEYNRLSRNKIWALNVGPECQYYDAPVEEYTHNQEIWPRGRHLHEINLCNQLHDFFRFMWSHTKVRCENLDGDTIFMPDYQTNAFTCNLFYSPTKLLR